MKNVKAKIIITSLMFLTTSNAHAAEANPFDKLIKILDFITDKLTSEVATVVIGMAVIIGGFLALRGRIPWPWFGAVLTAALIISGGSWLAQLFMTGAG